MADIAKELQEKRVQLADEIRSLADQQDKWTDEQRSRWDAVNTEYDDVVGKLDSITERQRVLERRAQLDEHDERITSARRTTAGEGRVVRAGLVTHEQRALAFQGWLRRANDRGLLPEHEQACHEVRLDPQVKEFDARMPAFTRNFAMWDTQGRPGWDGFNEWRDEQRNMVKGTDASGGYTVPTDFAIELERKLLAFGGPRRVARVIQTASGQAMPWPVVDDTSNTGEIVAEAGPIGTSVDPTFTQISFGAYKFSSKPILVSSELLEDSAFNLMLVVAELLGERIGRSQSTYFTTGTGSSQPLGCVVGSTLGKTAASATALAADELIDLQASLDPAYESLPSVGWMMNNATKTAVRKLKDTTNQYLWQPGLRLGEQDLLLGRPLTVNPSMASIATGQKTILYGAFEKFVIRDAAAMRFYMLTELYRGNDLVGFCAFQRSDSKCLNTAAIKHLIQA